ncbi:hypothetical protein [Vitiosangium sp. GDMCC 1.1324]|uniref:hypothetical protein n=1 Tax=Vitiosangium sp. (strain GDMCC 1.1324) TaxID=2138576 RepID=UPI001E61CBD8|nr:hypothetical protein [Vitiosangium sp. GDMCC 1.1324]
MRHASWKRVLAAAVVGTSPAVLAATQVEPRARLSLEERYDDDFRLHPDGQAGGQLMTKLTPRLGLDVKDETLTLESFYAADFLVRHGSGSMSLDHRAGASVRKLLSRRLRVEVSGSIYRVTDPSSLPRESVARSAEPVLFGQSRVYVTGRATRRVDVGAGYGFEGVRVFSVGGRAAGFVHTPFVEAWLRTSRRLSLGLEYRYQGFLFGENFEQAHGVFAALRYRLTRQTTFTLHGGPVAFQGEGGTSGVIPRVRLELLHEAVHFDLGLVAGHDLVGASGFTNALWADFAGLVVNRHFSHRVLLYGVASFFRNGRAPGDGLFTWGSNPQVAQGYALGAGLEFKVSRNVSMQAAVDRIAQVGMGETAAGVNLTRNVAAIRLHMTAW